MAQSAHFSHKIDAAMKWPRHVFNEAADQAVLFWQLQHDCWDGALAKRLKGFDPPLAADQIVPLLAARYAPATDRDRPLQTDALHAVDDLAMDAPAATAGIEDGNLIDWDQFDQNVGFFHQAASAKGMRAARSKSSTRFSNR